MTSADARLAPARRQSTAGAASSRGATLLDAGTEVTMQVGGVAHHGVVQSYEPQHSFGTFPVRFHDGQWRLLSADEVAVAASG